MAVAHSAASESHTGSTGSTNQAQFNWTHTQTGTPQGVLVFVHTISATDTVASVTYGGISLTRVTGGVAIDTTGEPGRTDLFFLGSGLPTGDQRVAVDRTNNATIMYASAATVTAATATNVTGIVLLEGDGTMTVQSVTDGGAPTNSLRYAGAYSGLASPPPAGTGSTLLTNIDFGAYGCAMVRETTAGTGARNVGFNSATDDRAAVHVAVRELWNRTDTQTVGSFTLTGNNATFSKTTAPKAITAETGSFTLSGKPADLRHNVQTTGGRGQFFLPERNLLTRSEEFDNAAWQKSNSSITANAIVAPDGTLTADQFVENALANVYHGFNQQLTKSASRITYTASAYVKPNGRNVEIGASESGGTNGLYARFSSTTLTISASGAYGSGWTFISATATSAGDGWYRISLVGTSSTATTVRHVLQSHNGTSSTYTGDGVSGFYAWGAQLEEGSTLTDYDPTGAAAATPAGLKVASRIDGGTGAFALTGNDATLAKVSTKELAAETGAFTLASNGATLRRNYALTAEAGAFAATGQPATLRRNPRIEAATGSFALNGGSPALLRGYYLSGGAGTFIETGQPVTFRRTWAIQGSTGSFALTGNPAGLTELGAYEIDPIVGSFSLSGQQATLAQSRTMPVDAGSFAFGGQPATLRHNPAITADRGQFTLSGQQATLTQGFALAGGTGAFSLTGNNATLTKTAADQLTPLVGAFTLSGQPATLSRTRLLMGGRGQFTLTWQPANLLQGWRTTGDRGQFLLTDNPAVFAAGRSLLGGTGSLTFTGNPAGLGDTDLLDATAGAFILTGLSVTLAKASTVRRRNVLIF